MSQPPLGVAISGASRGLGRALARDLHRKGARLALASRTPEGAERLGRELGPERALCVAVDLGEARQARAFVLEAREFLGRIDALVLCHGWAHPLAKLADLPVEHIERSFQVNVLSLFHTLQAALPVLEEQKAGTVVLVSSFAGRRAVPRLSAYSATKFATRGLAEAVAKEAEGTGVRCVSVSPGGMDTDMRKELFGEEDAHRQQRPEDVAQVLERIITGELAVPNGADVVVRNGQVAVRPPEV